MLGKDNAHPWIAQLEKYKLRKRFFIFWSVDFFWEKLIEATKQRELVMLIGPNCRRIKRGVYILKEIE